MLSRAVPEQAAKFASSAVRDRGGWRRMCVRVKNRMVAPLEHIIRNAVSHGIESPMERVNKGKPEMGVISIDVSRDGSDVVVKVNDDGAGINLDKVRGRALQLGLIADNHAIADNDLVQLILEPGFSTAEHVTQ